MNSKKSYKRQLEKEFFTENKSGKNEENNKKIILQHDRVHECVTSNKIR